MEETSERATKEGSLSQDRHAIDLQTIHPKPHNIQFTMTGHTLVSRNGKINRTLVCWSLHHSGIHVPQWMNPKDFDHPTEVHICGFVRQLLQQQITQMNVSLRINCHDLSDPSPLLFSAIIMSTFQLIK